MSTNTQPDPEPTPPGGAAVRLDWPSPFEPEDGYPAPTPLGGASAEAAWCLSCGTTGGFIPAGESVAGRRRGLCNACYQRARRQGIADDYPECGRRPIPNHWTLHPDAPRPYISPAMLGILPGQPPTDPDLTPDRLWQIGNTNARRAIRWLMERGHTFDQAIARSAWTPATLADDSRAAA